MIMRNIRHGFEGTGITDEQIDSYDVAGPYGMGSGIRQLDPFQRSPVFVPCALDGNERAQKKLAREA